MEEISSDGVGVAATTTTDPVLAGGGGSFSQLLFSDEAAAAATADVVDGQLVTPTSTSTKQIPDRRHGCFNFAAAAAAPTFSCDKKPPTMLSFGEHNNNINDDDMNYKINGAHYQLVFANEVSKSSTVPTMNSVLTCSSTTAGSSPTSSTAKNINSNNSSLPKSSGKRNGCNENGPVAQSLSSTGPGGPVRTQRNCKNTKSEISAVGGHAKVKKVRLGERIAALQQLVSPFGKTDTASVLHEAMGYIKFLQEQVQVLCSPYLECTPSNSSNPLLPQEIEENEEGELKRKYLRSRGLCLVPVDCTLHVAESNGADFWSPVMVNNGSSER